MNIADFEKRFVTTSRLLRRKSIQVVRSRSQLDPDDPVDDGSAQIYGTDADPLIYISLETLESALLGFRDTGTWDDYFYSQDEERDNEIVSRVRDRGGLSRYKLDVGKRRTKVGHKLRCKSFDIYLPNWVF